MRPVELSQGSAEWRAFRRTRITATDFCVIAANNKLCKNIFHKSTDRLIRDKLLAIETGDNLYFELGRTFEPIILGQLDFVNLIPGEIYTLDSNDLIMASLDARDPVLECVIDVKTQFRPISELQDKIDYYKYQIAHQCYVVGYDAGYIATGIMEHVGNEHLLKEVILTPIIADEVINYDVWYTMCTDFLEVIS